MKKNSRTLSHSATLFLSAKQHLEIHYDGNVKVTIKIDEGNSGYVHGCITGKKAKIRASVNG